METHIPLIRSSGTNRPCATPSSGGLRIREKASPERQDRSVIERRPRLIELLASRHGACAFQAVLGVAGSRSLWINFARPETGHVLVLGGADAVRSDFLRALALGTALTTRPALLQIVPIDLSGRHLHPLEILPHTAVDTASEPVSARASLRWIAAELRTRKTEGRAWPRLFLVIDDLPSLLSRCGRPATMIQDLLEWGAGLGMHIIAGSSRHGAPGTGSRSTVQIEALGDGERFTLRRGRGSMQFRAVSVSASDLDLIARMRTGRRSHRSAPNGSGRLDLEVNVV